MNRDKYHLPGAEMLGGAEHPPGKQFALPRGWHGAPEPEQMLTGHLARRPRDGVFCQSTQEYGVSWLSPG